MTNREGWTEEQVGRMTYRCAVELVRYWNRCPPRNEWWAQPGGPQEKHITTREELLAFAFSHGVRG